MISQPSMTWLLVTIWPSGATKKPVPMLASFFPGATGGGPPLRAFWMRLMRRFLIVAGFLVRHDPALAVAGELVRQRDQRGGADTGDGRRQEPTWRRAVCARRFAALRPAPPRASWTTPARSWHTGSGPCAPLPARPISGAASTASDSLARRLIRGSSRCRGLSYWPPGAGAASKSPPGAGTWD